MLTFAYILTFCLLTGALSLSPPPISLSLPPPPTPSREMRSPSPISFYTLTLLLFIASAFMVKTNLSKHRCVFYLRPVFFDECFPCTVVVLLNSSLFLFYFSLFPPSPQIHLFGFLGQYETFFFFFKATQKSLPLACDCIYPHFSLFHISVYSVLFIVSEYTSPPPPPPPPTHTHTHASSNHLRTANRRGKKWILPYCLDKMKLGVKRTAERRNVNNGSARASRRVPSSPVSHFVEYRSCELYI